MEKTPKEIIEENLPQSDSCVLFMFDMHNVLTVTHSPDDNYMKLINEMTGETARNVYKMVPVEKQEKAVPLFKHCDDAQCINDYIIYFLQVIEYLLHDNISPVFLFINRKYINHYFYVLTLKDTVYWAEYDD